MSIDKTNTEKKNIANSESNENSGYELAAGMKKLLLWVAIAAVIIIAGKIFIPHDYLKDIEHLPEKINALGPLAPLIFIIVSALLIICGTPRLLFCPIAGAAFGFLPGLSYCVAGTLIAYYAFFIIFRWTGSNVIVNIWKRKNPKKILTLIGNGGIASVILIRQIPVHGTLINLALAISPVRHRDFIIGSAFGILPQAIPLTLLGGGATDSSVSTTAIWISLAFIILCLTMIAFARFFPNSYYKPGKNKKGEDNG
jgi:uncharacterized membrane protein YdjX (TVP38/TMEM64 family)